MTIGIEAQRGNNPTKTGVEHYVKELIVHLGKIDSKNRYILYLRTPPEKWFADLPDNFSTKILGYGKIPFPYLWTQLRLSWEMLWHPPDVLFIPAASLPIIHPKNSVVTLHDVAWRMYPEAFKKLKLYYLEFSAWFACKFSKRIIAVSDSTKRDLMHFYNIPEHKIATVPHGYEAERLQFEIMSDEIKSQLPEKYFLFLSTLQPRKNVERLIDAFRLLKQEQPGLPHKLVVVGRPGWKFQQILRKIDENKDIVVYLNHISDSDRWPVYHKAHAFVYPSLYEGFGMPILEAFACGVPVLTANNSSLPEVGGDGALYFDPNNTEDIKSTIKKLLDNPQQATLLVQKGTQQLALFGWERCAKETLAVLSAGQTGTK